METATSVRSTTEVARIFATTHVRHYVAGRLSGWFLKQTVKAQGSASLVWEVSAATAS